jgi:hypothetical protein
MVSKSFETYFTEACALYVCFHFSKAIEQTLNTCLVVCQSYNEGVGSSQVLRKDRRVHVRRTEPEPDQISSCCRSLLVVC